MPLWLQITGWVGNACFFSRFLVQWWVSERAKQSVAPRAFWWLSLVGGLCLGLYVREKGEAVLLVGYVITFVVYCRNLWLGDGSRQRSTLGPGSAAVLGLIAAGLLVWVEWYKHSALFVEGGPWLWLSVVGQLIWTSRFLVQWWHSERVGAAHFPRSFWWLSLVGNALLLAYALHLSDAVLIAGYLPGPIVQVRNLMLGRAGRDEGVRASPPGG